MSRLLVLRPEPGAGETCLRAAALGFDAVAAPLFVVRPLAWQLPEQAFDAVAMTSANAARLGGALLDGLAHLPCYAVGRATAAAARSRGFLDVRPADGDGAALAVLISGELPASLLHLAGREHVALETVGVPVARRLVYAADPVEELPDVALAALRVRAVAMIHSPRSAALFASLVDAAAIGRATTAIAAISKAVAVAAGAGWREVAIAAAPDDDALLAAAARLCDT